VRFATPEAVQILQLGFQVGLPDFYLTADLPVLANPAGLGVVHAADDLVAYGAGLPLLATHTGLPEATLAVGLLAFRKAAPTAG
jgi:hypothetical protein